ncbi:MAG: YfiR family protein [Alphaproteobacteria bacterium]|nr:YfiR family protein [Alphaproteobacteria bacterium]
MHHTNNPIAIVMMVIMLTLGATVPRPVQAKPSADEAAVKVGYIYNFMKFVEWPNVAGQQDYIVCVLGSNPFGQVINSLGNKTIRNRGIRVVTDVPLEQTKYCHVVFVSRSESGRLMPALLRMRRLPLLTISDIEGFSDKGGVIELISGSNNDISFRVSQKTALDIGLHVSSKLLSMSR